MAEIDSPYLWMLKNQIDIRRIPFSARGSRILVYQMEKGLEIRLAEKWKNDNFGLQSQKKGVVVEQFVFTDAEGKRLDYQLDTYPHRIDCRTEIGVFSITFISPESLLLSIPESACGIQCVFNMDQAQTDKRGGVLKVVGDMRRNLAYTTNRPIIENDLCALDNRKYKLNLKLAAGDVGGLILNITPRLGFNRYVPSIRYSFSEAAKNWHNWFDRAPKVADRYQLQYYYAWWVMQAGLVSTRYYFTREAMLSSKAHSVGVWQWDAYFHALAYRHVDRRLAQDQLRILLDHQRSNGMIPDAIHDDGIITQWDNPVDADITKPPLLAWIAWKLYEEDRDKEFLSEIYDPLTRWNEWWFKYNDLDGDGLVEVPQLFPNDMDDPTDIEDDNPVISPDLNTYLFLQMESLSKIANALGDQQSAALWNDRAESLLRTMKKELWDGQAGLFWARQHGRPICVPTPYSLFPLLTGKLEKDVAQKLVDHLCDPEGFWVNYPYPTVALDDPDSDSKPIWRGPSWVSVNYLLMEGLDLSGFGELADDMCQRTLDRLMNEINHPESGMATEGNPPKTAPFFGWTAALFIELALRASRQTFRLMYGD